MNNVNTIIGWYAIMTDVKESKKEMYNNNRAAYN